MKYLQYDQQGLNLFNGWKKSKEVTYSNFTQVLKTGKYLWFSQG